MSLIEIVKNLDLKGECKFQKSVGHLTRLQVGGLADVFYVPYNEFELAHFLRSIPLHVPITVIGNGSNILVRDKGIHGVVIKLGKAFSGIYLHENHIYVKASTSNWVFAKTCMQHSIGNFEFLEGIPGSIGGGIYMNAGSWGYEFCDSLLSIDVIDRSGIKHILNKSDVKFAYRSTDIPKNYIIIGASFVRAYKDAKLIKQIMHEYHEKKKSTQPIYSKTAGSTFINPQSQEKKAWNYIFEIGGLNMRVGDAIWSPKHLNFIINMGSATASDLENLIMHTREEIYKKFSLMLELEVQIIGKE